MENRGFFITANHTGAGKTLISALLVNALKADYWKPVQCGDLENSDTKTIERFICNTVSKIHPERYRLALPASPHAAAEKEGINIRLQDFVLPKTNNRLIVEGAGGLLVPLNYEGDTMADLIKHLDLPVIFVSHLYLGSINHTMLSVEALQARSIAVAGIIFNGEPNPASEKYILNNTGLPCIARIPNLSLIDKETIMHLSENIKI